MTGRQGDILVIYFTRIPSINNDSARRRVADDGVNGFLSKSNEQWIEALEKLYKNVAMRAKMGADGRKLIESKYCTNVTGVKITQLLTGLTKE